MAREGACEANLRQDVPYINSLSPERTCRRPWRLAKFRWPAMEKDETVARRLPKDARDYFGGD